MSSAPPTRSPAATRCAACGDRLVGRYFVFLDSSDQFCGRCVATRPRCSSCGAPLGPSHWQLHDGRLQCARCHSAAVYDIDVARAIYRQTVEGVAQELDLRLQVGVEFRLVDAPALATLRSLDGQDHPDDERTLGLYQRQGRTRAIYLLYGLPRLSFRTTVAHEYAHAWQGEHCPLLEDAALREGFAEWVAFRHLRFLGCTRAADRMRSSNHPYRPFLEQVLALEQRLGSNALIDYMKRAE